MRAYGVLSIELRIPRGFFSEVGLYLEFGVCFCYITRAGVKSGRFVVVYFFPPSPWLALHRGERDEISLLLDRDMVAYEPRGFRGWGWGWGCITKYIGTQITNE